MALPIRLNVIFRNKTRTFILDLDQESALQNHLPLPNYITIWHNELLIRPYLFMHKQ